MEHWGHCLDLGRMQSFQLQPSFGAWQSLVIPLLCLFIHFYYSMCAWERESMKAWHNQHMCLNASASRASSLFSSVSMIHFVVASRTKIQITKVQLHFDWRPCTQISFAACRACPPPSLLSLTLCVFVQHIIHILYSVGSRDLRRCLNT